MSLRIKGVNEVAQETWGLKLDLDLKEKVQDIIRSDFDSSKEFLEQLVNMYELHQLKQGENILTSEIEELESLTRRINNIFINSNARINTMLQDKDQRLGEQVEIKQKLIEKLQRDLGKLEEEKEAISLVNDELVNSNKQYLQEVNQLTQSTQVLNQLVNEYKDKNDHLAGLLLEYKQDREENKGLREEIITLEGQLQTKYTENEYNQKELMELKEALEEKTLKFNITQKEALDKYTMELEATKRSAEIQTNLQILELQKEYQKDIQLNQSKHMKELEQVHEKYNKEIEQYQVRYKELLEKLEKKSTTKSTKPKKNNEKEK